MKRSYPVLDNRPIDQWKVTELKEELKKRRLPLRGLKDDLIRRLADDIEADEKAQDEANEKEQDEANEKEQDEANEKEQDEANEEDAVESIDNILPEVQNKTEQTPTVAKIDIGSKTTETSDMLVGTPTEVGESPTADATLSKPSEFVKEVTEVANDKETDGSKVAEGGDSQLETQTEAEKEPAGKVLKEASEPEKEVVAAAEDMEANAGSKITEGGEPEKEVVAAAEDMEASSRIKVTESGDDGVKNSVQGDGDNTVKEAIKLISEEAAHAPSHSVDTDSAIGNPYTEISDVSGNDTSGSVLAMQEPGSDQTGRISLDSCSQLESQKPNEDIKMPHEEVKHDLPEMNNQVSEVSPSLGLPIQNDSISTDSISVNQNLNALKDNIIADDVKLEPDVKPEIVQQSSSHVVSVSGESHPMDVEETDNNVTNADIDKKNSIAELGSPEKLNLDRSSGDDSMEEDTLENKQVVSQYNSDDVGERNVKIEVPFGKEENVVDVVVDVMSTDTKDDNHAESKRAVAAASEKRKFPDQETIPSSEPSKRQRRWANEKVAAVEPQSSTTPLSITPREASNAPSFKRSLSRNNSNSETPKERVVPPATKPASDSLRIDNFVRPFTLKAVQELLGKTGTVSSFWMDHIKTHCYVTFSSVEEAIETRTAVYNLQWPPNGGKFLVAEFVDATEVKARLEGPPPTQPPTAPVTTAPPPPQAQPSPRQQLAARLKQPQPQQPVLPPPPPISDVPHMARERVHLPPPPPLLEKMEPPIMTLDDLFRKTKTTPRIYYLPLSEEQVKTKLEARSRNSRQ